jgi:hypothetical protein
MKIVDIANEIFVDSGQPTSTTIPAIAFWVRGKIGDINNLLCEDFIFNNAYEVVNGNGDEIAPEAVSIIKKLYKIYDYEVQIRSNLNALTTDSIIEVMDQGSSVRKVNKNEVSKTLASLKTSEETSVKEMVTAYKLRAGAPQQVTGDDEIRGYYNRGLSIADLRWL